MAAHDHGIVFAVAARLQIAVNGIEKIVAVELGLEAEDAASEQAFENLVAPGADAHALGVGPGDVPEDNDGGGGKALADHGRSEGEMIVLHQDDGVLGIHFAADGVSEFLIDGAVEAPIFGAEDGPRMSHMAKRPESFVGEAVVVALLFLFGEPDTADVIGLLSGGHADMIVTVHGFAVGAAAAVSYPNTGAGAHDGLERGDQAAGGMPDFNFSLGRVFVDVGLAIGEDNDRFSVEVAVECLLEALGGPQAGRVFAFAGHARNQFAHVAQDGLKFAALFAGSMQQFADFKAPLVARAAGDQNRDAKGHDSEKAEDSQEEELRIGLAALDVAEVVDQNGEAELLSLLGNRHGADQNAAGGQHGDGAPLAQRLLAIVARFADARAHLRTTELIRHARGDRAGGEVDVTGGDCDDALVCSERHQLLAKICRVIPGICQGRLRSDKHQLRTRLGIALKPFAHRGLNYSRNCPR